MNRKILGIGPLLAIGLITSMAFSPKGRSSEPHLAVVQNPDPAAALFGFVTVLPTFHINVASTGAVVDRSGYAGAMLSVLQGHVTNGAGAIVYWVVQDSSVTPAQVWTAVDSVLADTVDSKTFKLSYKSNKRFLRCILRATSASSDTTFSGSMFMLTGKRTR
jgi:hypothetical protein